MTNDDPLVPVFLKHDKSWPKHDVVPTVSYVPLSSALQAPVGKEAYVAQYSVPSMPHRLSSDAPKKLPGGVCMVGLFSDVDATNKKSVAGSDALRAAWWQAQQPAISQYRAQHPGAYIVLSQGGLHIYELLAEVIQIRTARDAAHWSARYEAHCAELAKLPWVDAKVDNGCKDWTRLIRVPWDIRVAKPAELGRIGDPCAVGRVALPAAPAALPGRMKMSEPRLEGPLHAAGVTIPLGLVLRMRAIAPGPGKQHAFVTALGSVCGSHSRLDLGDIARFVAQVTINFENAGDRPRCALDFAAGARNGAERMLGWGSLYQACEGPPIQIQRVFHELDKWLGGSAEFHADMTKLVNELFAGPTAGGTAHV